MQHQPQFEAMPILMDLVPVIVQGAAIAILLLLTYEQPLYALTATILSLVWLKTSREDLAQELGELRAKRRLFQSVGEWLDRPNAAEVFDTIYAESLHFEPNVEDTQHDTVVTARGVANFLRAAISFLLHGYLVFVLVFAVRDLTM